MTSVNNRFCSKEAILLTAWLLLIFSTPSLTYHGHRGEGQEGGGGEGSPGCGREAKRNGSQKASWGRCIRQSSESSRWNTPKQKRQPSWEKLQSREVIRRKATEWWVDSPQGGALLGVMSENGQLAVPMRTAPSAGLPQLSSCCWSHLPRLWIPSRSHQKQPEARRGHSLWGTFVPFGPFPIVLETDQCCLLTREVTVNHPNVFLSAHCMTG